jgi:hypothetical protein
MERGQPEHIRGRGDSGATIEQLVERLDFRWHNPSVPGMGRARQGTVITSRR